MKGPYGFELTENCENCKLRSNGFFCQLQAGAVKDLDAIKFYSAYPEGAVLFIERQTARGVYILCEGQVKLSISSSEGKKMILRIAKAGEVLGLVSALAGTPHEVTAETLRPARWRSFRETLSCALLPSIPRPTRSLPSNSARNTAWPANKCATWAYLPRLRKNWRSFFWISR